MTGPRGPRRRRFDPRPEAALLGAALWLALRLFHGRCSLGGARVRGPRRLVAFHHPFHLLDPIHVGLALRGGPLWFLADSVLLFGGRFRGWLSRRLRAVPLHRPETGRGDFASRRQNVATMRAAVARLVAGESVAMAPEGRSLAQRRLLPLRAGTARIALEAAARVPACEPVRIVPVGLVYRRLSGWPLRPVTVAIGAPLAVRAPAGSDPAARQRAEAELNAQLDGALRAVTVDFGGADPRLVEDLAELEDADLRAAGLLPGRDDLAALRAAAARAAALAPATALRVGRALRVYLGRAEQLGIAPGSERAGRRRSALLALALCPAALGVALHAPPLCAVRRAARRAGGGPRAAPASRLGFVALLAAIRWFAAWDLGLALAFALLARACGGPPPVVLAALLTAPGLGLLGWWQGRRARCAVLSVCRPGALVALATRAGRVHAALPRV
ncbi:MAG: 1-acyl-sn-glycerol-3-phosphate acyltransferase [Planctomycetes bacterium]|nr:1-acyl-sn-glycerol-3-phosphate acyltransferase [Planctomycetota bacterium]